MVAEHVADVAVIGGTGLYTLFDGGDTVEVATPYGEPSGRVAVKRFGGRRVAFLPRHGPAHDFPAHRVPYRANVWALASLGVTRIIAPCAVGSLRGDLPPGAFVVPEQLIDRTHGREATYYDDATIHVPFADPYCPDLRRATVAELATSSVPRHDGGTVVVVAGPRFGTRAEARWYREAGADLVNMTALPEAALARELGLCYCTLAVVTDWDSGLDPGLDPRLHPGLGGAAPVTQADVMKRFAASLETVRDVVVDVAAGVPDARGCACAAALDGLAVPDLGLPGLAVPAAV